MSSQEEIVIISVGYKLHPLLSKLISEGNISFTIITNNSSDFQIHHADPSKVLNYHLEFTNIIALKAQKSIESLSIFETLGQYFELYNPLHLTTLNYLISKFATDMKPEPKNYLKTWKEIQKAIFNEVFILPLFEEIRVLHVKEGEVEIPVRQFIMAKDYEIKATKNSKTKSKQEFNVTGIIDLDEINKMKICPEAVKKIVDAAGVIIVPSDVVSLFIIFQNRAFLEALEKANSKITLISPFGPDNKPSPAEIAVLTNTSFNPTFEEIVKLVKDYVDVIIADKKDGDAVKNLRDLGVTILLENLSAENQQSDEFLKLVLRSINVDIESVTIEPKELQKGVGEKLVKLLTMREERKRQKEEETLPTEEEKEVEDEAEILTEIVDTGLDSPPSTQVSEPKQVTEEAEEITAETQQFEMDIVDEEKEVIPTPPSKEEFMVEKKLFPSTSSKFVLPPLDQINQLEWEQLESLDADEQIIWNLITSAIDPENTNIEIVFSELLSLQNNTLLIDKIFKCLYKKLLLLMEYKPEKRIADIITYLAAHKPEYYTNQLSLMIRLIIEEPDYQTFLQKLQGGLIIISNSTEISYGVFKQFFDYAIKHYLIGDRFERLRRVITTFSYANDKVMENISKVLFEYYQEHEDEEEIDKILWLLQNLDPYVVALTCVEIIKEHEIKNVVASLAEITANKEYIAVINNIISAFLSGSEEKLNKVIHGRHVSDHIRFLLKKRKYIRDLSKVGSIPLDIFAEQIGKSTVEAEKMIYDMILNGEIKAKIELVNGRSYIVNIEEEEEKEEKEKIVEEPTEKEQEELEKSKKAEPKTRKRTKTKTTKTPSKKTVKKEKSTSKQDDKEATVEKEEKVSASTEKIIEEASEENAEDPGE